MLGNIKNKLHLGINELFAAASVDEATGDNEAYERKLEDIAIIAKVLGYETKIVTSTLYLTESEDFLE